MPSLKTGQCKAGWHEGTKPRTSEGIPIQVCRLWQQCPCDCHENITAMFSAADSERELLDNPDYMPKPPPYYVPVFGVDYGIPKPLPTAVSSDGVVTEGPSAYGTDGVTGGRGALEIAVLGICRSLEPTFEETYTTKWIAEQVADKFTCKTPSTGAIQAVLERWVKIGFAIMGKKPVRFIAITPEGEKDGLELMKARAKRG